MLLLEDKVSKMMNAINDADIIVDNLFVDDDYLGVLDDIDSANIKTANGLTKAVFIDKSSAYVLKMPIFGQVEYEWVSYSDDDEDEDYYDDGEYDYDNPIYTDYMNANSENGDNYCEDELNKYELVVAEGFSEFFPATSFYGMTNNGIPVYMQERVRPWNWYRDEEKISDNSRSIAKNVKTGLPEFFLAACIDFYGFDRAMEFVDWLKIHNEFTSDLHTGNIGTRENGAPVILDFSGFHH